MHVFCCILDWSHFRVVICSNIILALSIMPLFCRILLLNRLLRCIVLPFTTGSTYYAPVSYRALQVFTALAEPSIAHRSGYGLMNKEMQRLWFTTSLTSCAGHTSGLSAGTVKQIAYYHIVFAQRCFLPHYHRFSFALHL